MPNHEHNNAGRGCALGVLIGCAMWAALFACVGLARFLFL